MYFLVCTIVGGGAVLGQVVASGRKWSWWRVGRWRAGAVEGFGRAAELVPGRSQVGASAPESPHSKYHPQLSIPCHRTTAPPRHSLRCVGAPWFFLCAPACGRARRLVSRARADQNAVRHDRGGSRKKLDI